MPDDPNSQQTPPAVKPPETFSAQYVAELRAENERLRKENSDVQKTVEDHKKLIDDGKKAAKDAVDAETVKWKTQIKHDRITSELVREGFASENMAALVAGKLASEAKIDWDEKGGLSNLKEGIEAFKKAEPSLFLAQGATTRSPAVPGQAPAAPRDMRNAKPEEVNARLRELGVRSL